MKPLSEVSAAIVAARLRAAGCVYAEDEAQILLDAANTRQEMDAMLRRRVAGFPLEHIVGWAAFHGLRITVAPGVFVPRHRTEFLVLHAADILRRSQSPGPDEQRSPLGPPAGVVLDLCCGSGAIGAALAVELPGLEIHAADIDPAAVECAARNLAPFSGRAHCGDLFSALPPELRGRISLIAANAPYVPTQDIAFMPREARLHEPDAALNGGPDGLDIQRRIASAAQGWLAPGGHLLVESSPAQAAVSSRILVGHGFRATTVHSTEWDSTVVVGRRGNAGGGVLPR